MGLAYKLKDTVLGEIVNKTSIVTKKLKSNNSKTTDRYMYMTRNDGEKIRDFLDLDDKRTQQINQDVQVLKRAYLSDEVVTKMQEEISDIFEKEYYSYTNRLHEYKNVLEDYRNYLDGIENRIRDYEKIALQTNTDLKHYGMIFQQYSEEINSYNDMLDQYETKLNDYNIAHNDDKELLTKVEQMISSNSGLDIKIAKEVNRIIERNNDEIRDYMEDEFTKIAARNIKSRRKVDTMFAFLLTTNIITIAGIVAMFFLK